MYLSLIIYNGNVTLYNDTQNNNTINLRCNLEPLQKKKKNGLTLALIYAHKSCFAKNLRFPFFTAFPFYSNFTYDLMLSENNK